MSRPRRCPHAGHRGSAAFSRALQHLPKITAGVRQSMGWTVKGAVQAVKGGRLAELRAVFDAHVTERLRGLGLPGNCNARPGSSAILASAPAP